MKKSDLMLFRFFLLVPFTCVAIACSGASGPTTQSAEDVDPDAENQSDSALDDSGDGGDQSRSADDSASADLEPACAAFESEEVDPLRRWIGSFPIQRGGAVLAFTGTSAEQMEVEMALEMAAIMGYEDLSCGTAVIVWVPGMECTGDAEAIADRIQDSTTMTLYQSACFRIDEVRSRIREECERGTLPVEHCP